MKKITITIITVFFYLTTIAHDIRQDFHNGMFDEDKLTDLSQSKAYGNSNLTLAYQSISKTMLADYMYFPISKLSSFNSGKAGLEKAIKNAPKNPEYRYLRLLVQLNAPFFLGYNGSIQSDVDFFSKNLTTFKINKYWKYKFIENLLAADELTSEQALKIKNVKKKIS